MRLSPLPHACLRVSLLRFRFLVSSVTFAVLMVASVLTPNLAQAQIFDWTNTTNTNSFYDVTGNWSPSGPPTGTDTAHFNSANTYQVWWDDFTGTPTVGFVQVNSGDVTFLNNGGTSQHGLTINGSGGAGLFTDFSISGATTSLTNSGLHLHSLGGGQIIDGATMTLDGSHAQGANLTIDGSIGFQVDGNLNVQAGGVVSSAFGLIGDNTTGVGVATVTGTGSQWNNSSTLNVGNSGDGTLNVEAGGVVSSAFGLIGDNTTGVGVATVTGTGSQWNNSNFLHVGNSGDGTLNVEAGAVVSNTSGIIGNLSTSTGVATVTGPGSNWNNSGNLFVGNVSDGTLNVEAGGVVTNTSGRIGINSTGVGVATVTGPGSNWNNSQTLFVGQNGNGTLNVEAGGVVFNTNGYIGFGSTGVGIATVTGTGSQWNNSGNLYVGDSGNGTLNVEAGGVVSNAFGVIGSSSTGVGVATVTGTGSQWNSSSTLNVGHFGNGTLNVEAGGVVSSAFGVIGTWSTGVGIATVTGTGSQWNNSGDLLIAPSGTGTLNIADNGLVSVVGTTTIGTNGTVNLTGGRFEFGQTTLSEFSGINAVSGSMAGNLNLTGYIDVATLTALQNVAVDLTDVTLSNSGILYGNASLGNALINSSTGEVETVTGERMRFAGSGNTNAGEINNFGGQIRFAQDLTNQSGGEINNFGGSFIASQVTNDSGGLVGGRGQFFANGGWTNDGVITMSGGFADIHGDVVNSAAGTIAIGGGSTTTFYDDVTMDSANLNMEIASDSYGVFFGSYNGGSNGLGTVQAFGDLRPGNSPAIVSFGGDLEMGVNSALYIELGGLFAGEFDQLLVAGDLSLDGLLDVSLIDGFSLGFNQEFLIADISGQRNGFFDGLNDGDLVGNYGGFDLFINYGAGTGNDVALFTAVPEPGAAGLVGLMMLGLMVKRRRRQKLAA